MAMKDAQDVTYTIKKLSEGFMARCNINPEIAVYGKTSDEAMQKIDKAIVEFEKLFPNRVGVKQT